MAVTICPVIHCLIERDHVCDGTVEYFFTYFMMILCGLVCCFVCQPASLYAGSDSIFSFH